MSPDTTPDVAANLTVVHHRIAQAALRAGRDPAQVRLLPVTKTLASDRVREAASLGLDWFGENKVQEASAKAKALADLPVRWSVIGHLQTNKARDVARFADEFQALDSLRLAAALDRALQAEGRSLDVMVQVNTSGESSKFGLPPGAVVAFTKEMPAFSSLRVKGLMTLAVFSPEKEAVRSCFRALRKIRDRLRDTGAPYEALSMGMSGDFEAAIDEGATVVRIGQAIFGPRALGHDHYWPRAGQT